MKILAIETSCDETALALVSASGGLKNPKFKVERSLIASQIKIHRPFGGVVPNLAKREHLKNLPILFKKLALPKPTAKRRLNSKSFDLISVVVGPGLEPALWTGIGFAKDLAKKYKKPLIGVSHLKAHLDSFLLSEEFQKANLKKIFPAVALIVSGGHTILLLVKDLIHYKRLGETRDDAAGEAFDKVARLLNLPYPGGPEIEKAAKKGNDLAINFPRPMINQKNYDFSFSGLKTAVLYHLLENPSVNKADVAASFQKAAVDVLTFKTLKAAKEFKARSILLSGGVAANKFLRKAIKKEAQKNSLKFFAPPFKYNTDNAAMVALAAYFAFLSKKRHRIFAQPNLCL